MNLRTLSLDELTIDDEASYRHIALYDRLKRALRRSQHRFRTPPPGEELSWDRALFLNLTFWSSGAESSVLCDDHITPDVIAHTAWHHVVGHHLALLSAPAAASAAGMLFGEAIASAFDLYLAGRLLENAPDSDFIASQLPIMAEAAEQAGLPESGFASLMKSVAAHPERAFEDLRALLFSVALELSACRDADEAQAVLEAQVGHRFEPLLHHFQLSNWVLYVRAYAAPGVNEGVRSLDRELRASDDSLAWLAARWLSES